MKLVIVPDSLRHAIDAQLDAVLAAAPEAACARKEMFQVLLEYFDEHGCLPDLKDISIGKTNP